jgi:hypothetical protein
MQDLARQVRAFLSAQRQMIPDPGLGGQTIDFNHAARNTGHTPDMVYRRHPIEFAFQTHRIEIGHRRSSK